MKLLQTFLFAVALLIGTSITAQKELSEVYIKMEISDIESSNPESAAMMEMLKGTETEIFHKDGKTLTALNMMGGMITVKNVVDADGNFNMFMDAMGNKMLVQSTKAESDRLKAENPNPMADLEFKADKTDTKTIAGYECYKVVATPKDAEMADASFHAYVSEEIKVKANVQGIDISEFPGFPLEFIMEMPEVKIIMTTVDLKDAVDDANFAVDENGYKKMTMEEFQSAMGGMGGGFGF